MRFFERRRYRKLVKHMLHEAQHARNMREDIADPEALAEVNRHCDELAQAWDKQDIDAMEQAAHDIDLSADKIYPPRSFPRLRENIEILVVAVAVAMAVRTYFVQPFKIPTGSLMPTLYGITVEAQDGPRLSDKFPLSILKWAFLGERYVEVRARASGHIARRAMKTSDSVIVRIADTPHVIQEGMRLYFELGEEVAKGQLLASGRRKYGDHIFVDKIRYNFGRPKRGDIFVFDTAGVDHPEIRQDTFYIKRLAGLPGETVWLDPPYLMVGTNRITQPYPFDRLLHAQEQGYKGYQLGRAYPGRKAPILRTRQHRLTLADNEYLPLGDNTGRSLDGRYFGGVKQQYVVGPAFAVYWPLSARWGRVR